MTNLLAVFLGGGLGSLLRYGISVWMGKYSANFPYGTLIANFLACLVLGVAFFSFTQASNLSSAHKSFILVGFCGGFSTFSTFSMETFKLIQQGQTALAVSYVLVSIFLCLGLLFGLNKMLH